LSARDGYDVNFLLACFATGQQVTTNSQEPNSAYVIENDWREQGKVLNQLLASGIAWHTRRPASFANQAVSMYNSCKLQNELKQR